MRGAVTVTVLNTVIWSSLSANAIGANKTPLQRLAIAIEIGRFFIISPIEI
jgi:hypothetical protein